MPMPGPCPNLRRQQPIPMFLCSLMCTLHQRRGGCGLATRAHLLCAMYTSYSLFHLVYSSGLFLGGHLFELVLRELELASYLFATRLLCGSVWSLRGRGRGISLCVSLRACQTLSYPGGVSRVLVSIVIPCMSNGSLERLVIYTSRLTLTLATVSFSPSHLVGQPSLQPQAQDTNSPRN